MKFSYKTKSAFTLFELILVIAVIVILAALLLPVLSHAKTSAQRTVCLSNLKQINVAIQLYCGDSSDKTPKLEGIKANRMLTLIGYKSLVHEYVDGNSTNSPNAKIFACPSDAFYFTRSNGFIIVKNEPLHAQSFVDYSSYGFNGLNLDTNMVARAMRRLGLDLSQFGIGGRALASVHNPSRTVLVAETPAWSQIRCVVSKSSS